MQLEAQARAYCALIEDAETQVPNSFVADLATALGDVVAETLRVPDQPPAGETIEQRPTDEEWKSRFAAVSEALATSQSYWTTLAPFGAECQRAVELPLADDLVDVWRDLKSGLLAIDAGESQTDVLWEWRFGFYMHWGRHASEALRALQARLADSYGVVQRREVRDDSDLDSGAPNQEQTHELTSPLGRWTVVLRTGERLTIWAHGVGAQDGPDLVFSALMKGTPHFEIEVSRVPKNAVEDWFGPHTRTPGDDRQQ